MKFDSPVLESAHQRQRDARYKLTNLFTFFGLPVLARPTHSHPLPRELWLVGSPLRTRSQGVLLTPVMIKYQLPSLFSVAKPTVAFVLSLIAGIIYLIIGLIVAAASSLVGSLSSVTGASAIGTVVAVVGGIGVVCGIVMIVGSLMMNSENRSKVRTGAVLVLVFTIIGALFTVGGFVIGFILGLVGSILGLAWKPPANMQTPPPAPAI